MELIAHITKHHQEKKYQSLEEHSINVAEYASHLLENVGFKHTAYLSGLLHDMGKATKTFNEYIEKSFNGEDVRRGSVNHTFAAVIYILEKYHTEKNSSTERLTAEICAYACGTHHGLFDCMDLYGENGFEYRLNYDKSAICYEEALSNFFECMSNQKIDEQYIDDLFEKACKEIGNFLEHIRNKNKDERYFYVSFVTKLVLSALIAADHKDTREFMFGKKDIEITFNWETQQKYYEEKIKKFEKDTYINEVRADISLQCKNSAKLKTGIYQLNVPTGGGKTLSSLRYALEHGIINHKERIIYIIPLLGIIDQNVDIIKDYLEKDVVLEHHSNIITEELTEDEENEYKILTDTWNSPVIVSTLVRLLYIIMGL